ncbi:MAG: GDP-mannose 4,6-dehydratase [Candidatus Omnitrophica bacterium]|nr:GDP-mannose 4,6-dehydratase [Candidatus Omnitrophota bacterium]
MDIKNKKIIVTGGAGFIGSHLVGALLDDGAEVMVLDNFSSGKMSNLSQYSSNRKLRVVKADILDRKRLFKLFRGVHSVYHLATQCLRISINNPQLVHEVNSTGTLNVCQAAQEHKLKRLIYVSSSEAYGSAQYAPMDEKHPCQPTTIYGSSKLTGELYARSFLNTYGLPVVIVRPFNTYGPRSHFEGAHGEVIPKFVLRALNNKAPVIFGDGRQTRDFTYVSDVVEGIILASRADWLVAGTVNIAYGKEVSIAKIARLVLDATGMYKLKPKKGKARPADVRRHYADISLAKRRLKYRPRVGIEKGIKKYVDWVKANNIDLAACLKQEELYNW